MASEVPPKDDRGDGKAGKRTADVERSRRRENTVARLRDANTLEHRRIRLPERIEFSRILKVAAQRAWTKVTGQHSTGVNTGREEVESVSIVGEAVSTLDEDAILMRLTRACGLKRIGLLLRENRAASKNESCQKDS